MARRTYTSKGRAEIELDGEVFSAHADMFELVELHEEFGDIEVNSAKAAPAFAKIFEKLLGEDYRRFREHCRTHGTDSATLMQILNDAVEDLSGRPLAPSSSSSDGVPITGRTLKVISSDGVMRQEPLTPEREAELRAAVERAAG